MTFRVQRTMCATCIFKPSSPLNLGKLLDDIRDEHMGFNGHRICHHSKDACCAGFWAAHKNDFQMGQVAQRLGMVEFVNDDTMPHVRHDDAVRHDAADTDEHNPMCEKPFWKWLEQNNGATGKFLNDLRTYLKVGADETGFLNSDQLKVYKATYQHFWWMRSDAAKSWQR